MEDWQIKRLRIEKRDKNTSPNVPGFDDTNQPCPGDICGVVDCHAQNLCAWGYQLPERKDE